MDEKEPSTRQREISLLNAYLRYDPKAGKLYWIKQSNTKCPVGKEAGSIQSNGYISIVIQGYRIAAQNAAWVLMTGSLPTNEIDHKNRIRRTNLREATHAQNTVNTQISIRNKSGHKGVSWSAGKWVVFLSGKYIGRFTDKESAAAAYRKAAVEKFGEFAYVGEQGSQAPELASKLDGLQ